MDVQRRGTWSVIFNHAPQKIKPLALLQLLVKPARVSVQAGVESAHTVRHGKLRFCCGKAGVHQLDKAVCSRHIDKRIHRQTRENDCHQICLCIR